VGKGAREQRDARRAHALQPLDLSSYARTISVRGHGKRLSGQQNLIPSQAAAGKILLTNRSNRTTQEIETGEPRPARSSCRAFDLRPRTNAAPPLDARLFLVVVALVISNRPLRRDIDSKREFASAGTTACKLL
jgi:hypothetical protein